MAVEDPEPAEHPTTCRCDGDLPGKVGHEADVVVPEHHLSGYAAGKELGEEVEDHGAKPAGRSDDRVLDVPRDEEPGGPLVSADPKELLGEVAGGPLRRTGRPFRVPAQAEMKVGDQQRAGRAAWVAVDPERRDVDDRTHPGDHRPGEARAGLTLGSRSPSRSGNSRCLYRSDSSICTDPGA